DLYQRPIQVIWILDGLRRERYWLYARRVDARPRQFWAGCPAPATERFCLSQFGSCHPSELHPGAESAGTTVQRSLHSMASVTYDHVYKRWGDVIAVNNLSLDVKDGEFLVLVGPSGCGKSTALRLLAGLEEISEGNIYIGDRLVNDVPPKDRNIAMVFQSYALYPHMSVYDNMAFGLKLRKFPKEEIDRRVR